MNFDDLARLITLAENAHIHALEITDGEQAIKITTQAPHAQVCASPAAVPAAANTASTQITPATADTQNAQNAQNIANTQNNQAAHIISAPMVGTFYRKSAPDTPNFVEVGDEVKAGDTLCILEAMKIMHEVKADKAGKIHAIIASDGEMVEFDEPLFEIV
ncbi:acetyl-CoA carboxylase, biotin carboxyl carrier protein [Moraxella caviae]|uniref:Biotin carboxyl carrier protein of acetyl-CoA carboxylase n=1 Tax=Moraxella caviae TaxID=34060 RepID=A0A1S9ZW56_9GAMM|nr:acetyl-CoA carboxylase, biotin carboxyl carrier protein [Moraxella caviae]